MTQVQTLLAATDLSAPARHAAARAVRLARVTGARLTLMHVVSQGALDGLRDLLGAKAAPVEQHIVDEMRNEMQRLAGDVGESDAVMPEVHLATGVPVRAIANHAEAIDAGLLILGARGEGFMRHLLLGSTAERLLRKTLRPILVVKQIPVGDYRRVLLPVDFSPWSRDALMLARVVAPQAELVLLHTFDVPFEGKLRLAGVEEEVVSQYRIAARHEALQQMRQLAAQAGLDSRRVSHTVLHGEPSRHIIEQEQVQDCELIVLGKHGCDVMEELLLGSVTKHVLAESSCDVLVSARPVA